MKSVTAFAALIGLAFAAASASSALARSSAPGAAPPRSNFATAIPSPPLPPGGPDKLTSRTLPRDPVGKFAQPRVPKALDDFAGRNNTSAGTYTCNQSGYVQACDDITILEKDCPGGMSSDEGGSVTCSY